MRVSGHGLDKGGSVAELVELDEPRDDLAEGRHEPYYELPEGAKAQVPLVRTAPVPVVPLLEPPEHVTSSARLQGINIH